MNAQTTLSQALIDFQRAHLAASEARLEAAKGGLRNAEIHIQLRDHQILELRAEVAHLKARLGLKD